MNRDLLLHELCHGLANIDRGCPLVTIKWDDDMEAAVTVPQWPNTATQDDVFIGLLAGRLHLDGVTNTDDEFMLRQLPQKEVDRLWSVVVERIKPKIEAVPEEVLDDMLDAFNRGEWIQLSPEMLH